MKIKQQLRIKEEKRCHYSNADDKQNRSIVKEEKQQKQVV